MEVQFAIGRLMEEAEERLGLGLAAITDVSDARLEDMRDTFGSEAAARGVEPLRFGGI